MAEHKLFAQRVGLIGITYVVTTLMRIFLVPILTKNLPIDDYGTWVQVIATTGLIPPIAGLGLPFALVRFSASEKNKKKLQDGFYSIFFVVVLVSGLFSLIFLIFSSPFAKILFDNNITVATIVPAVLFVESLILVPMNLFRALQKIKKHSFFLILDMLLTVFLASYFIIIGLGIVGAIVGLLISKVMVFAGMMIFVYKEIGFEFPIFMNLREYFNFSLPLLPANLSSWIINSSDRYIITIFLGTAFAGYYAPGYTLGSLISTFAAPLSFMLPPVLSKYYDENKLNEFKRVLNYSSKYFLLLAIPSVFGLSFLSKPILNVLTTSEIASVGYLITPYTAVSYLIYSLQGIIGNILVVQNKTKIIGSIMSISAVINLGLNIIIVPLIGINGAALTTLISFILIFIVIYYNCFKTKLLFLDFNFIIKSIIASSIMGFVLIYISPVGIIPLIITIFIGAIVYFGIILLLKGIRIKEIKFFFNFLRN